MAFEQDENFKKSIRKIRSEAESQTWLQWRSCGTRQIHKETQKTLLRPKGEKEAPLEGPVSG